MKPTIPIITTLLSLCAAIQAAEVQIRSPDGQAVIAVTDAGGLRYSVFFDGREVVAWSRFGIVADGVDLGADVTPGQSSSRRIRESYPMFGGHSEANNDCREATLVPPQRRRRSLPTRRARLQRWRGLARAAGGEGRPKD